MTGGLAKHRQGEQAAVDLALSKRMKAGGATIARAKKIAFYGPTGACLNG